MIPGTIRSSDHSQTKTMTSRNAARALAKFLNPEKSISMSAFPRRAIVRKKTTYPSWNGPPTTRNAKNPTHGANRDRPPDPRPAPPETQPPTEPLTEPIAGPAPWYAVLQLAPEATTEEIRAAYYRLAEQYRPDKVQDLGAEIRELAARRLAEIETAYQEALRSGGRAA